MLVELAALAVVIACLFVGGLARPAGRGTARRDDVRRLRFVQAHPERANSGDLDRLLSLEVSTDVASFLAPVVEARGLEPGLLWRFAQAFGPRALALAVAADLDQAALAACVDRGCPPPVGELEVFAAANGLPEPPRQAEPATRRRTAATVLELVHRALAAPSPARS